MAATRAVVPAHWLVAAECCVRRPQTSARLVQTVVSEFAKRKGGGGGRKNHLEKGVTFSSHWREG
jgi:hypothetical protein